jgi:hypothetical protein
VGSSLILLIYNLEPGTTSSTLVQYSVREPFSVLPNMSMTYDAIQNIYTTVLLCGSKTCLMNEACIQDTCVQKGSLSFVAQWSRQNGQGYIIVRTPLNNTIYIDNPRTNSSVDKGQHELVSDGSQVDNIYWPSNSIPPKGVYKICFSTGSLLNGSDTSPVTVTIQIRRFHRATETMTYTFNTSATDFGECMDTSDTFVGSVEISMFSPVTGRIKRIKKAQ